MRCFGNGGGQVVYKFDFRFVHPHAPVDGPVLCERSSSFDLPCFFLTHRLPNRRPQGTSSGAATV